MRWLQDGLPLVGEKTTLRWLGSSVVELKIQQAKAPFRSAEILFVLEPRDLARPSGASLACAAAATCLSSVAPCATSHAWNWKRWTPRPGRPADSDIRSRMTGCRSPYYHPLVGYTARPSPAASELLSRVTLDACPLVRLAVYRAEPNLEVQWRLDPLCKYSAPAVFQALRRTAERL